MWHTLGTSNTFARLSHLPTLDNQNHMRGSWWSSCIDRWSEETINANDAKFARKQRAYDGISPTETGIRGCNRLQSAIRKYSGLTGNRRKMKMNENSSGRPYHQWQAQLPSIDQMWM